MKAPLSNWKATTPREDWRDRLSWHHIGRSFYVEARLFPPLRLSLVAKGRHWMAFGIVLASVTVGRMP